MYLEHFHPVRTRTSTIIALQCIALVLSLLVVGCSETTGSPDPKGSICTPNEEVEPQDCYVGSEYENFYESNHDSMDSPKDVRRICESSCTKMKNLYIDVEGLENLKAFSRIRTIDGGSNSQVGQLSISGYRDSALRTLDGLNVEKVGDLRIQDNPELEDIEALRTLETVKSTISITYNPKLRTLDGLEGIDEIPVEAEVNVLELRNNGLTDVSALENLTLHGGMVTVASESNLETLDSLDALGKVQHLTLSNNEELRSLDGLSGLEIVTDKLKVFENPRLPSCLIDQFRDRVESDSGFSDGTLIRNNGGYQHEACE